MIRHTVPDGVPETPLSKYIPRAWPMIKPHVVRKALKQRDVRVNGVKSGADDTVRAGDEMVIYIEDKHLDARVEVLFDDGQLMAVVKPQGLPVDGDAQGVGEDTLINRLTAAYPGARLVHRLDAGTGGVMLIARTPEMETRLMRAFSDHKLIKRYRAVVCGVPKKRADALNAYLMKDADSARVRVCDRPQAGALPIQTKYRVLDTVAGGALSALEIDLITGRTHQIRAHMAHIGHPLLGDDKYGDRAMNKRFSQKRPCLWCRSITFAGAEALKQYEGMTFQKPEPELAGIEDHERQ